MKDRGIVKVGISFLVSPVLVAVTLAYELFYRWRFNKRALDVVLITICVILLPVTVGAVLHWIFGVIMLYIVSILLIVTSSREAFAFWRTPTVTTSKRK